MVELVVLKGRLSLNSHLFELDVFFFLRLLS